MRKRDAISVVMRQISTFPRPHSHGGNSPPSNTGGSRPWCSGPRALYPPGGCSSEGRRTSRGKRLLCRPSSRPWEQGMTTFPFSDQQAPPTRRWGWKHRTSTVPALRNPTAEDTGTGKVQHNQLLLRKDAQSSLGFHRRLPGGDWIYS